jgi:hypothetical protein
MLPSQVEDASGADRNGKGTFELVGTRGLEVLRMAANALSFLVGIVLPLGGAIWLLTH